MNYPKSDLFEKLADIEHQRWADWQKYMFSLMENIGFDEETESHVFKIPAEHFNRWHRQTKTDYKPVFDSGRFMESLNACQ